MYKAHEDVACKDLDDHSIVVNIKTGFYYSLNEPARFVYECVRDGRDAPSIAREMAERYAIGEAAARQDLAECLETLVKEELIVVSDITVADTEPNG